MTKVAAIMGSINAALGVVLAFGVDVSTAQESAIIAAANAVLLLVAVLRDPNIPFSLRKKG